MAKEHLWLKEIPSAKKILNKALNKVEIDKEDLSKTATLLESKCEEIYRRYEKEAREKYRDKADPAELEKSLNQTRVTRGGRTVELIFYKLLDEFDIEYEKKPKINEERPDIVIPSKKILLEKPESAVIISIKRKVRERWREVVGEAYILRKIHKIPDNIWFFSLFEPPKYAVKTMVNLGIRVYVSDRYYVDFKNFGARRFSEMFKELSKYRKTQK